MASLHSLTQSGLPPTPPPSRPTTLYSQPRLFYFISRSNGNLVPLVPADELPYSVRLAGIPRVITLEQTQGMQHVGMLPFTGQFFKLDKTPFSRPSSSCHSRNQSATSAASPFLAPDAHLRCPLTSNGPTSSPSSRPSHPVSAAATATNWRNSNPAPTTDPTQAAIDAIVASNPKATARLSNNSTTKTPYSPNNERKKYCTHWIRHGECDYTQQGCRYKHEIPDKATLSSIGFRTIPRWYQEKMRIKLTGSAMSTVGDRAVKSNEWLKRRTSVSSDADDESDDNEDAAVSTSEESGNGEEEAQDGARHPRPRRPATATAPTTALNRPSRVAEAAPSFAPLLPTPSSSDQSSHELTPRTSASSSPTRCPAVNARASSPPTFQLAGKGTLTAPSPTSPPRKVFVPAGESKDYHVEEARKHRPSPTPAPVTLATTPPRQAKPRDNGLSTPESSAQKASHRTTGGTSTTPAAAPQSTTKSSHSTGSNGLRASRHTPPPPPTFTPSPPTRRSFPAGKLAERKAGPRIPRANAGGPRVEGSIRRPASMVIVGTKYTPVGPLARTFRDDGRVRHGEQGR